jgi:diguanylate cyclase (GGDEF)-like protein
VADNRNLQDKIDQMIASGVKLPSPPAIAVRILNAVQQPEPSLRELAEIISSDPALTVKMLQVANSGFYSLRYEVTSVEKALTVLGVNALKNIALSFVIAREMTGSSDRSFDFNFFWRRAVTFGVAAELLSNQIGFAHEDTFVTALLADIGILMLYQAMPEIYGRVFEEKKLSGEKISPVEKRLLGLNHAEMGSAILERWQLPPSIYLPIRYHHQPELAPAPYKKAAEILLLADHLSAIYHDLNSAERVRHLKKELTERFILRDAKAAELIDNVARKSIELLTTFDISAGDLKPYSQLLQEANEELGRLNLSYEQLIIELKQAKAETDRLANEVREANTKLHELVFRDGLTGLYNHRYFQEMVDKELDRGERYQSSFALIMFDIDFFKKINDSYGHPNGDLILINIARIVQKTVRPSDIVARYGGEEFCVILPESNEIGLKIFAERLRRSVEQMITLIDNREVRVSISVGGTCYLPQTGKRDKKEIIATADRALYKSKHNGRNQVTLLPLG